MITHITKYYCPRCNYCIDLGKNEKEPETCPGCGTGKYGENTRKSKWIGTRDDNLQTY